MNVEAEVLARVKPTPEEDAAISEAADKLVSRVMSTAAARACEFEPYLVGSIAKDTHLRDADIDLFLLFDPRVAKKELERHGLAIGREAVSGREHYAEHPYIKGEFMGLKVDIVPAYRITDSSRKMTAVDRTPFHTEFVKERLAPELRDHVRLLKAFMKGIGTYGAEARVMGFSGYLCELLVIGFGGFRETLEAASDWNGKVRLHLDQDPGGRFDGPMVFIDPVDPGRNVASAVSVDSLAAFIAAAGDYLDSPDMRFFFPLPPREMDGREIAEALTSRGDIILVAMPRPDIIDDVLYPQVRKCRRNICQFLSARGFTVMDSAESVTDQRIILILELESARLPEGMLHAGPPVWVRPHSADFLARWENDPAALSAPFIGAGKWQVFVRRQYTDAPDALRAELGNLDLGRDLNALRDDITVHEGMPDVPGATAALSLYLGRRPPWRR